MLRSIFPIVGAFLVLVAGAQAQSPADRADAARIALSEGRLTEASALLSVLTSEFPDDAGLHWLYARVQVARGDPERAISEYRIAALLAPADPWLRLELGRTLLEDGQGREVETVLAPVAADEGNPTAASEAEKLMGLAAYWDGDLLSADAHLSRALALSIEKEGVAEILREVRSARAPELRSITTVGNDDQPLRTLGEALAFSAPVSGRVRATFRGSIARRTGDGGDDTTIEGHAGFSAVLPGGRVHSDIEMGAFRRGAGLGSDVTGAGRLGIKVAHETFLRGSFERWAYQWTVAALDTSLVVATVEMRLDRRDAARWAGEVIARRDRFPDENSVTSASVWLLAPAWVRPDRGLRAGYAGSFRDSDRSTFMAVSSNQAPSALPIGMYFPYYTPSQLQTHSVLIEARAGRAERTSLQATFTFPLYAREVGPFLVVDPLDSSVSVDHLERSFQPWSVSTKFMSTLSSRTTIGVAVSHNRNAFYTYTNVEAVISLRLVSTSPNGDER